PKPASEVSTDPRARPPRLAELPAWPPPSNRAPTASACAPYRELIELALRRGRNAMAIWQDLVDEHGFPARYASVRRFVVKLGGPVDVVVLDNLKEGVLTPDVYDPTLNPLYRDVLAHYGVVALPCRVGAPDRKGEVESAIGHTQSTPLTGLRFASLEEAQAYLDRWEARWADTRIHGTTK